MGGWVRTYGDCEGLGGVVVEKPGAEDALGEVLLSFAAVDGEVGGC